MLVFSETMFDNTRMIERFLLKRLEKTLSFNASVALLGPRQCGKTTLAQCILSKQPAIYLDLESPQDLVRLSDPVAFFSQHEDALFILDEVQHAPHLFKTIRGIIDKNRRNGKKYNQFLFLGSASIDLLKQSSESLAGRISYIEMMGFNCLELPTQDTKVRNQLWLRGGFPDSYLAASDDDSMEWLENFIRSYLQRDIPQFGFNIPAERLRRFWTMVAHSQGETLNYSKLASNLGISDKTVARYLDILVDLFLLKRLEPWHANVKKRLIKSPRFYIRDSGILHKLLAIKSYDDLLSHPVVGKSWEGFVIDNILSIIPQHITPYFYRTLAGAEIDLLLDISNKEKWAVEIKNNTAPKIRKGFYQACEELNITRKFVIYGGSERFPMAQNTEAIGIVEFLKEVTKIS